jgi:hypothetical protein
MAPGVRAAIFWAMLTVAGAAHAAEILTPGDLGWLSGNLNLAGDSPALLVLTPVQKSRLHALIANRHTGPDRKRQAIVQFLTAATDGSLQQTLDESTLPPASNEVAGRPR